MKERYLRIARYSLPHWRAFGLVLLMTGLTVAVETLKPWPLQLAVDVAILRKPAPRGAGWLLTLPGASSQAGLLAWFTSGAIVLFTLGWAVKAAQSYLQADAGARMQYELGADLFVRIQRLSLRYLQRASTGDLVQRVVVNSACVRELMFNVCLPVATAFFTLAGMTAVMWHIHHGLTLVALATAPLLFVAIFRSAKPIAARSGEQADLQGVLMSVAERTLSSVPVVQAFGREATEDDRFSELSRKTGTAYVRTSVAQLIFKVSANTVTALGTGAVMLYGGLLTAENQLTPGVLLVVLSYLAALYQPLETLAYASSGLAYAAGGVRRVMEVMEQGESVEEAAEPVPLVLDGRAPRISFENVTFGYERDRAVLKKINLEIPPGETVAIVGPTGSGKSTLLHLLCRLYDPWEGRICINGLDIRCYRLSDLREALSVVLQDAYLLPGSVLDNIRYGRPEAREDEVRGAVSAAQLGGVIGRLPDGMETPLGERGGKLSGGERQQVAIARAFVKNAHILLLDEPTASLDALTEASLMAAMEELKRNRTAILVAHRPSTIRKADRVVVLRSGQIVETHTHEEMAIREGGYNTLWGVTEAPQPS